MMITTAFPLYTKELRPIISTNCIALSIAELLKGLLNEECCHPGLPHWLKKAPKRVTSGGNIGSCFKIQNQRRRRRRARWARAELWTPERELRRRRRRPVRRQLVGIILLRNEINVHPPPPPSQGTHSLPCVLQQHQLPN